MDGYTVCESQRKEIQRTVLCASAMNNIGSKNRLTLLWTAPDEARRTRFHSKKAVWANPEKPAASFARTCCLIGLSPWYSFGDFPVVSRECVVVLRHSIEARRGKSLDKDKVRILSVDDSEPWRRFVRLALLIDGSLQIVAEASDGLEAIHRARELRPDLVLLDIGLPTLNGIETARQIRKHVAHSRIVMVSENRSRNIAEEAFRAGASCYVAKSDAGSDLLSAVRAALRGEKFVSTALVGYGLTDIAPEARDGSFTTPGNWPIRHEVGLYSHDQQLLVALTQFVGAALDLGNAAIVIATEPHRDSLLVRLQQYGVNANNAVEQGRYIALDAAGALSTLMVDNEIDAVRFFAVFDEIMPKAAEAAKAGQCRVAIFGECVHLLWAQGNVEAAIKMESLGSKLANKYDVDILCAYSLKSFQGGIGSHVFEKICAEHSAVHNW